MFNALDDSSQLITRNLNWSAHGLLLVNMTPQKSGILAAASSRAAERGKQPINNCRGASPCDHHRRSRPRPQPARIAGMNRPQIGDGITAASRGLLSQRRQYCRLHSIKLPPHLQKGC
jgi:hypothetical protein